MKKSLRQNALAFRNQLSADEIASSSHKITASLVTLLQTFKPCTVGLFYPTQGEPNILEIMGSRELNDFSWALPVCWESSTGQVLRFASFGHNQELEAGQYNIPVPLLKNWAEPQVLLIPCVAFHRDGSRLGYGAGWYDKTLSQYAEPPTTVGVAYAATESTECFREPHDQLLDYIVTEQAVITSFKS